MSPPIEGEESGPYESFLNAVWEICDMFDIEVTNNLPKPGVPEISDFIDSIIDGHYMSAFDSGEFALWHFTLGMVWHYQVPLLHDDYGYNVDDVLRFGNAMKAAREHLRTIDRLRAEKKERERSSKK